MVLTSDPQSSQFEQMILSTQIKYFTKYEHTKCCLLTLEFSEFQKKTLCLYFMD